MDELKPCPFCGGSCDAAHANDKYGDQYIFIACSKCGCRTDGFYTKKGFIIALDSAEKRWNRRVEADGAK